MFIPKSKVTVLVDAISTAKENALFTAEETELLDQICDRALLCFHGDAPFLEIEVCYANKPK